MTGLLSSQRRGTNGVAAPARGTRHTNHHTYPPGTGAPMRTSRPGPRSAYFPSGRNQGRARPEPHTEERVVATQPADGHIATTRSRELSADAGLRRHAPTRRLT